MKKLKYLLCLCIVLIFMVMPSALGAASCMEYSDGEHRYTYISCSKPKTCACGETSGRVVGHSFKTSTTYKAISKPTANKCRKKVVTSTCTKSGCNYKQTTTKNDTTHRTTYSTTKATCTSASVRTKSCIDCTYKEKTVKESAKGHDYSKIVKTIRLPSCSMVGIAKYKCSRCSATTEKTYGKIKSHLFTKYVSTKKEATCSSEGIAIYKCVRDGCNKTKEITISKTSHPSSVWENTFDTHYMKCTVCGQATSAEGRHKLVDGKCFCGIEVEILAPPVAGKENNTSSSVDEEITKDFKYSLEECPHRNGGKVDEGTSPATCLTPATCLGCGFEFGKPLGHDYIDEWKFDKTNHYKYCERCASSESIVKFEHRFKSDGICESCGYVFGNTILKDEDSDEPEILDSSKCSHPNKVYEVTKESTCTEYGAQIESCVTCDYTKTIVMDLKHDFDSGNYFGGRDGHWKRCSCGVVDNNGQKATPHDWNSSRGVCTVCDYVCTHVFNFQSDGTEVCERCDFVKKASCVNGEHDWSYKADLYTHRCFCSKCGIENESFTAVHKYTARYGDGKYRMYNLGNGYHARICSECGYKLKKGHIYVDGCCSACGDELTMLIYDISFTYTDGDIELIKGMQTQLKKLGYYNSDIDAVMGNSTRNAINELLAARGYSMRLGEEDGWEDITSEMYTIIMKCTETKTDYLVRNIQTKLLDGEKIERSEILEISELKLKALNYYNPENVLEKEEEVLLRMLRTYMSINGIDSSNYNLDNLPDDILMEMLNEQTALDEKLLELINDETELLTDEQNELLNEIILLALETETAYDQLERMDGPDEFEAYFKNGKKIEDMEAIFDCSSFCSMIMELVFGLDCTELREYNGKEYLGKYATSEFGSDEEQFEKQNCTQTGIDVSSLKKGQLILVFPTETAETDPHIMIYLGNGLIAHSNGSSNAVTIDELSSDNPYTADFLNVNNTYDEIYVLTPKQA